LAKMDPDNQWVCDTVAIRSNYKTKVSLARVNTHHRKDFLHQRTKWANHLNAQIKF